MEGNPQPPQKKSSAFEKVAQAAALGAALHGGGAVAEAGKVAAEVIATPEAKTVQAEPGVQLDAYDFTRIPAEAVANFKDVFRRATPEQKQFIKNALTNDVIPPVEAGERKDPELLAEQQQVRDLQQSGEMAVSGKEGAHLPQDNPQKYLAQLLANAEHKAKAEEMQRITIESADQGQIERWVQNLKEKTVSKIISPNERRF